MPSTSLSSPYGCDGLQAEKESAEKQLKELMARFKLRKALLHWRHRKLTLSFRSLVTMVFKGRIEAARELKKSAERTTGTMDSEISRATADRQRAEMAKRKSDEMVNRELALKKECELELKEAQKQLSSDGERSAAAGGRVDELLAAGARESNLGHPAKDELIQKLEELQQITAATDQLTLQLKRRVA